MPYIKAITKAGNTLIIEKYYSSRWHKKGVERNINLNKTTEAQEKCNLRKAERKLTILLNANFTGGDYHLVLDYSPDNRPPTPRGCHRNVQPFIRKLRRIYRKAGAEIKYVEVCEFGKKGALHHHLILNFHEGISTKDIQKKWPYGRVHFNPMDDSGEYSKLAAYITKNRKYWKECGGKGKQYSPSRNLHVPETRKTIVRKGDGYYEKPRARKGYQIAPDSDRFFVTEAGWPYMRYILVKSKGGRSP